MGTGAAKVVVVMLLLPLRVVHVLSDDPGDG
jgi:hypothetical protein